MADTENNKNFNSPALRFPGFTEPWQKCRLGDYIHIFSGESPNCVDSEYGKIPYYKVEQLNWCEKYLGETPYLSRRGKNILPEGCVVFSKRGAAILTNKVRMNLFPINIDTNLMGIKADNSYISDQYLFYFILRARLSRIADTSTIPQINNIHINPITINVPSFAEQEIITKFLALLDERIATQRRLIEDLEKLKSSIIDRCYRGNEYIRLGDFITQVSKRNKSNIPYKVMSVSNVRGFVPQSEQFADREIASENTASYKIVAKDIFAYNPARINIGSIARFKGHYKGIVSPMYVCFSVTGELQPQYLEYFFQTRKFKNDVELRLEGSVRLCLNFDALCEIEIPMLSLAKQIAISSAIETLDNKIVLEQKLLSNMDKQRKYLLSKLFI